MKLKITVHGVAYEVDVEVLDAGAGFPAHPISHRPKEMPVAHGSRESAATASANSAVAAPTGAGKGSVASPIAGQILEIKCKPGDQVSENQILLVIEAMKMKTSIAAPTSGKIRAIPIAVGDSVQESQILVEFE